MSIEAKLKIAEILSEELSQKIAELSLLYCLSPRDILPWLTATLIGQMALCNLKDEFVRATFDRMYEQFKKKKEQIS